MSEVRREGTRWIIRVATATKHETTIAFDSETLAFDVERAGAKPWRMTTDGANDLTLRRDGETNAISLARAARKDVSEFRTGDLHGVRAILRGFTTDRGDFDVALSLVVAVDTVNGEVVARVTPVVDPAGEIREVRWPRPFAIDPEPGAFHLVPTRNGCLMPVDWPGTVDWWWIGLAYTTAIYMPVFGALRPGGAYLAILETPFDGGIAMDHPAGGPTRMGPKWHPSMGSLRYARQVRYALFGDVDLNALVARYREYVRAAGKLKTLEQKALDVPRVRELEGTTVAAAYTLYHTQPDSHYYNADDPARNHRLQTFADLGAGIEKFAKEYPSDRVVVHVDGWGLRGYDNLHPDILPPCPEAGGWDGFRAVADAVDAHGWLFATHDNYIDFYKDAATYSNDLALWDESGQVPSKAWWLGGAQAFLCEMNALGYIRRNFEEILRRGVKLSATYVDVFSIIELWECYHAEHRMSREECMRKRVETFDWVRSKGIVLSSEEPCDWSASYCDFYYWAPLAQAGGLFVGQPVGIPVPFFNQTYHDCCVTPASLGKQGEISAADAFLWALSYGNPPLVGNPGAAQDLSRPKILADLHRRIGFAAIERHDLLAPDGSRRLTTFSGGATVEVDFPKKRWRTTGVKGMPKAWQTVAKV